MYFYKIGSDSKPPIHSDRGFTVIELISVIVLVGILSAVVLPRFSGKDGFAEYAVRDQVIAGARIAQQRAMYDHTAGACYRLSISSNVIRVESFNGTSYSAFGPSADWVAGIAVTDANVDDTVVYFNGLGSPLDGTANCAGTTAQANILINNAPGVRIYETGYVQAQF